MYGSHRAKERGLRGIVVVVYCRLPSETDSGSGRVDSRSHVPGVLFGERQRGGAMVSLPTRGLTRVWRHDGIEANFAKGGQISFAWKFPAASLRPTDFVCERRQVSPRIELDFTRDRPFRYRRRKIKIARRARFGLPTRQAAATIESFVTIGRLGNSIRLWPPPKTKLPFRVFKN